MKTKKADPPNERRDVVLSRIRKQLAKHWAAPSPWQVFFGEDRVAPRMPPKRLMARLRG